MEKNLSSNALKLIAITAMTIDHFTSVIFPGNPTGIGILLLHTIGRLAMPVMCFFIAEGYHYTHDVKKYAARLFVFAFISHFAYNFAFGIPFIPFQTSVFNQTSVFWSLAWGLVALAVVKSENPKLKPWMTHIIVIGICIITFCADWSCIGVLIIVANGKYRNDFKKQMSSMLMYVAFYSVVYILFVNKVYGILQMMVVCSIPLLMKYNGKRGSWKGMKWFFYLYYPLHLVVCGIVRLALHGNIGVMIGGI